MSIVVLYGASHYSLTLTNSKEEGTSSERCRRRVQNGVKHRDVHVQSSEKAVQISVFNQCVIRTSDIQGATHISKSLSTSSGVTNPCTKISGGLCCSIKLARISRSWAGPEEVLNQSPDLPWSNPNCSAYQVRNTSRLPRPINDPQNTVV